MLDKEKLEKAIRVSGLSKKEIADELDIDETTLYRKINGISDFYREEISVLCKLLKIKNPKPIFFKD